MVLGLLTLGYIAGEIAHFQIGTVSRDMAQDIEFGKKKCYSNETIYRELLQGDEFVCEDIQEEAR